MNQYFLERWAEEGPALVAPLAREICRIGRALNRMRINGQLVTITSQGIEADVAAPASALPFVFLFTKTGPLTGTWKPGKAFIAGVDAAITGMPEDGAEIEVSESTVYWIAHNFALGTLSWNTGSEYPSSTDSLEVYPILEITVENGVISGYVCRHPCDIHATARSY